MYLTGERGEGSEPRKKDFVDLKSASNFAPLQSINIFLEENFVI